jgi:transcription factor SFP1
MPDSFDFNNVGFGLPQDLGDLTIHEPAKRLSSRNGNSSLTPQQLQLAMTTGQIPRDSNLGNSQLSGLGGSKRALEPEPKKYRCPVIGCEKAYKNQNGLKYHKVVSDTSLCSYAGMSLTIYSTSMGT